MALYRKTIKVGIDNTLNKMRYVIKGDNGAIDVGSLTVKAYMIDDADAVVIAETTTGVTRQGTFSITASATTSLVSANEHRAKDGDQLIFATSGTLPTGIDAGTRYFATAIEPNAFKLATSPGGPRVSITGLGSGSHTAYIVGEVLYDWQAADVDTAGDFVFYWQVYSGSEVATYPVEGIAIHVLDLTNTGT